MKKFVTMLLLLFATTTFSQNKNFSVEVNYPFGFSNGMQRYIGIAEGNFKYWFLKKEMLNIGAAYTFTFMKSNFAEYYNDLDRNLFFHHINGVAELNIASVPNLHPYVAFGFTYASYNYEYYYTYDDFTTIKKQKESDPGFNMKLGVQYDLSNSFLFTGQFSLYSNV